MWESEGQKGEELQDLSYETRVYLKHLSYLTIKEEHGVVFKHPTPEQNTVGNLSR